jgi:exo-1,4-beta-D-glucosaminidase
LKLRAVVFISFAWFSLASGFGSSGQALSAPKTVHLKSNWKIQNSDTVAADGSKVSLPGFDAATWTPAKVPSTILANLVGPHIGDGTPDDPFYSNNWLKLPGSDPSYYVIGKNFGDSVTPPASPFGHPWWYRVSFALTQAQLADRADLHLNGITYGADIWLNGQLVAGSSATRGSYRQFKFDITSNLHVGENTLAVLVNPPLPTDLTPSWVDWNPTPQDKNMGLWREVFISFHGPVSVRRAFVSSEIQFPGAKRADLTIESEVENESAAPVTGVLHAEALGFDLAMPLTLAAHEVRRVLMTPTQFPKLKIKNPKLWWPWQMGEANIHPLEMSFVIGQTVSDETTHEFGIRKIESQLTPEGSRLFLVNGKRIFVRGGGWASDLLLRFDHHRQDRELNYVKMLGLNTIRLEGRFETESLLTLADRKGLLVMPGWVCCNAWQKNSEWTPEHLSIAHDSLVDQLYELRSHASVFVFLYGSDEIPSPTVESAYLGALTETRWPNPALASASAGQSVTGETGVKMTGPYAYTPPSYWYVDKKDHGGAWGFNTETSPGISMPPLETLSRFIPADHLGSVDAIWDFHLGENEFTSLAGHKAALDRRYGQTKDAFDLVKKSQVMDYDNHRAMFEAYQSNKYHSATGVVQWMLNSAWPSLMWHLYDYDLRPNAAFYGVKKANAKLHVLVNPDDLSVHLVNSTYSSARGLVVSAKMLDLKSHVFYSKSHTASSPADSAVQVTQLPTPTAPDRKVYFVELKLHSATGELLDTNFYWLSQTKEQYDWPKTDFKQTPILAEADLSALQDLPKAHIGVTVTPPPSEDPKDDEASVVVTNSGNAIAFFIKLDLFIGGSEVVPVDWDDNSISLLPGETRVIRARIPERAKYTGAVAVHGSGWNVDSW